MELRINKNILAETSSIVQRAASTRDVVPALSGLLLSAQENQLILEATDLDVGIKKIIEPVNVVREGKVLVNAKYFSDLVSHLSDEEVTIFFDQTMGKLNVLSGLSSSFLNVYNPDDFPEMPFDKISPLGSISQPILKSFIRKTAFAAAITHFKPVFTGSLLDFSKESFTMVASDTHRLAIIKNDQIKFEKKDSKYIIPVRTLTGIARILEEDDAEINIGLAENHIVFYTPEHDFYCSSRLIEGQYPNYLQVIPSDFANTFCINADLLTQSLDRAALLPINPKMIQHVKMKFSPTQLIISAYSEKMGETEEIITDIEAQNDKSIEVNFNTRYLLDVIKLLASETKTIQISLSGPLGPAVIKNPSNENYIYVLVPLRTS